MSAGTRALQGASHGARALAATLLAGVGGVIVVGLKPLLLSTYVAHLGLDPARAGGITAIEMTGALLGTLAVAFAGGRFASRPVAAVGLALVCISTLACLLLPDAGLLALLRFASGTGAGLVAGTMAATIARMREPDRVFGAFTVLTLLLAAAAFAVSPAFAAALGGRGIFVLILLTAVPGLLAVAWYPNARPTATVRDAHTSSRAGAPAQAARADMSMCDFARAPTLLAIGGMVAFYVAVGGVWPFVYEIGVRAGFDATRIAAVLAASQVAGAIGALVPLAVGARFGRLAPLCAALVAMIGALLLLVLVPGSFRGYTVAVLAYMGMWLLFFPYLMGTMAALDPSGRLSSLAYAVQSIGFAVGPAAAALLVQDGRYDRLLWAGAAAHAGALLLLVMAHARRTSPR